MKQHPDFKIALGDEIYLVAAREKKIKYYHFILIAKNAIGHKALRELSSHAWMNSYWDRDLERVPVLYDELAAIVKKYPNSLIATSACFRKGNKVLTQQGEKNIEDITDKDYVLNMYGQWEKVNYPTSREYEGNGYEINFLENEEPIICTEDHQFLTITNNTLRNYRLRGTSPFRWVKAKNLNTQTGGTKNICLFPIKQIKYTNNNILRREEWQYCLLDKTHTRKKLINDTIIITPEVMRLFGLFLGDGSISILPEKNYYCINFSFNDQEFPVYWESFFKKASEDIGVIWSISKRPELHKVDATSHSIDLVELFYSIFSNIKSDTKFVPLRLKNISKELDYELVFGYELADGYFREKTNKKKNINSGEMVSASISYKLSKDIQELLKNMGIRSSLTSQDARIGADGVRHNKSWYLSSSNNAWKDVHKLKLYNHEDVVSIFEQAIQHCANKYIEIDGVLYKKVYIKERKPIKLKETVYCLNVDSHSFCCGNVIVHNCLGGQVSQDILNSAEEDLNKFLDYCIDLFGDDFYIECAPGCSKDQITANKGLRKVAAARNIRMVIGTDAHYLRPEDRYVHEAYLNSKGGEREVASFYEYAYLQNEEEIFEHLSKSSYDEDFIKEMFQNSMEIYNKIEIYDLTHKQHVPLVEVPEYPKKENELNEYPILHDMYESNDKAERYWVNQCIDKLKEKGLYEKKYLDELEYEADIKRTIGEKLETNMFMYPITLQHYIDLIWECGSTVGAGRGSSCAGLNHYLLGITQLNSLQWDLPFFRYLNKERVELGSL